MSSAAPQPEDRTPLGPLVSNEPATTVEGAERRQTPRLAGGPPISVIGLTATVYDISRGGICLQLEVPVKPGDRYRLNLLDELEGSTQVLATEVVWSGGGRAGFRWIFLTPEQDAWLAARFQAWLHAVEGTLPL